MLIRNPEDTICALSTPAGTGALGVIRVSGKRAFEVCDRLFTKPVTGAASHTARLVRVHDSEGLIDESVAVLFRGPRSFTGEDTVEISCHGSEYIIARILKALLAAGCRLAEPGEFSMRAFANGKTDLSSAEAIADLIASSSEASHRMAMNQMRGGLSRKINGLRQELIDFASLIELELDFSEEDVEFANREDLKKLLDHLDEVLTGLISSFAAGSAIKNGIPVAILGAPNMGKSTLLNALLEDDKAIVSDIPGTTRDTIEDEMNIGGIRFRFIDTAGIRDTDDVVEGLGIARTYEKARQSAVILFMTDAVDGDPQDALRQIAAVRQKTGDAAAVITLANKADRTDDPQALDEKWAGSGALLMSATQGTGLDSLRDRLLALAKTLAPSEGDTVVSNLRHYEALSKAREALRHVRNGLDSGITGDFLAVDIRKSLHHLGEITGEITTDDLLGNIFSRFCIGK